MRHVNLTAGLAILASISAGSAYAGYTGSTINGTLAFGPNGSGGGQFWPSPSRTVPGQFRYSTTN